MTNSKSRLENYASQGASHEKHFQHADLHDSYGVGTFFLRTESSGGAGAGELCIAINLMSGSRIKVRTYDAPSGSHRNLSCMSA